MQSTQWSRWCALGPTGDLRNPVVSTGWPVGFFSSEGYALSMGREREPMEPTQFFLQELAKRDQPAAESVRALMRSSAAVDDALAATLANLLMRPSPALWPVPPAPPRAVPVAPPRPAVASGAYPPLDPALEFPRDSDEEFLGRQIASKLAERTRCLAAGDRSQVQKLDDELVSLSVLQRFAQS